MTTPTTDAPVTLPNGIVADPAIHCFRDGQPILKTDGTPKLKPGRKPGSTVAKAAPAPESEDKVPLSVGKDDAVPAAWNEVHGSPAMQIVAASTERKAASTVTVESATPPVATQTQAKAAHLVPMTAVVTRTFGKIGLPESKEEPLEVRTFVTPPAHIELGYGLTLNIGNYESARVDVKLNVPCYREEVDEAYEWARKWAEDRVRREVKEVRAMAAPPKSNPF